MNKAKRWAWNICAIIGIATVVSVVLAIVGLVAVFNGQ